MARRIDSLSWLGTVPGDFQRVLHGGVSVIPDWSQMPRPVARNYIFARVGPGRPDIYDEHVVAADMIREQDMGQFGMGQPVRRVEDQRFITGTGRFTDDIV